MVPAKMFTIKKNHGNVRKSNKLIQWYQEEKLGLNNFASEFSTITDNERGKIIHNKIDKIENHYIVGIKNEIWMVWMYKVIINGMSKQDWDKTPSRHL